MKGKSSHNNTQDNYGKDEKSWFTLTTRLKMVDLDLVKINANLSVVKVFI